MAELPALEQIESLRSSYKEMLASVGNADSPQALDFTSRYAELSGKLKGLEETLQKLEPQDSSKNAHFSPDVLNAIKNDVQKARLWNKVSDMGIDPSAS